MNRYLLALALLTATATATATVAQAQQEGPTPTQALVSFDSKAPVAPTPSDVTIKVDNRATPLSALVPVPPSDAQVAILIDDGLRRSISLQLKDIQSFIQSLPPATEVFVGYMQNGRIISASGADPGFTSDHAAAAAAVRMSVGLPGVSASPYFCLSDFVKHWPGASEMQQPQPRQAGHKARFVLMITNGVDPYNGSTSIMNQDSPYVQTAQDDAQRAGVPVYSIYYPDAGFSSRRGRGSFSGQSYLFQVADATGGASFYQGTIPPVSLAPFLKQFQSAVAATYVATFDVPANKNLARIKISTTMPKTKVRAPDQVRPGNLILQ
jgi:hypothetical protein